jgi:hypothetical protein
MRSFRPNAPDQHLVVKGDTLWDISGAFLEHPWCWPEVWGMNRDEIRNPHWIYPGQIIYFDRAHGRLTAQQAGDRRCRRRPAAGPKLSPQVRTEELGGDAISSIPSGVIEPFLTQPLVVENGELDAAPRIAATPETRVYLAEGDRIYVRGDLNGATVPGLPSGQGTEGSGHRQGRRLRGRLPRHAAKLVRKPSRAWTCTPSRHQRSVQEMGVGDRLLPIPPMPMRNYVPHAPARPVNSRA